MSYSLKNMIEWSEKHIGRPRNLVLYSVVILYLFITIVLFFLSIWVTIPSTTFNLYYTVNGIFVSVIAFYTTTAPKSNNVSIQENQLKYFKDIFSNLMNNLNHNIKS